MQLQWQALEGFELASALWLTKPDAYVNKHRA